jgi:hypothetical protein
MGAVLSAGAVLRCCSVWSPLCIYVTVSNPLAWEHAWPLAGFSAMLGGCCPQRAALSHPGAFGGRGLGDAAGRGSVWIWGVCGVSACRVRQESSLLCGACSARGQLAWYVGPVASACLAIGPWDTPLCP